MQLPALSREWLMVLIVWTLLWKGPALWRAARNGDRWWYVAILLLSTLGVLEYIYLFIIQKDTPKKSSRTSSKK